MDLAARMRGAAQDLPRRALLGLALVVAADLALWQAPGGVGLGWPLFLALAALAMVVANPAGWRALGVAGISLLPLLEHVGPLSIGLGIAGLTASALIASGRGRPGLDAHLADGVRLLVTGPFWLISDLAEIGAGAVETRAERLWQGAALWALPLALGAVFLGLFAGANPVIDNLLAEIRLADLLALLEPGRIAFWVVFLCFAWAFLRVRPRPAPKPTAPAPERPPAKTRALFSPGAVLRGLILFNGIFAVQTVLDLAFLWGGLRLPDGLTYAEYAHRGAYPLIWAVLLAGLFTLIATREGSRTAEIRAIRLLCYLWTGQTLWLVCSAVLRLSLYVEFYALTGWRVAAFIWMGLVALGLILVVLRLAVRRSNRWLLNRALGALLITLYGTAFLNVPAVIAEYNVSHSYELSGRGVPLDRAYLCRLGVQALPAIGRFNRQVPRRVNCHAGRTTWYDHRRAMEDWRHWTGRNLRLAARAPGD
ncbi:MAG: DUF4173 domain-containing protein [Pseudomonadota bacterium]